MGFGPRLVRRSELPPRPPGSTAAAPPSLTIQPLLRYPRYQSIPAHIPPAPRCTSMFNGRLKNRLCECHGSGRAVGS